MPAPPGHPAAERRPRGTGGQHSSLARHSQRTPDLGQNAADAPFQVMPALSADELDALEQDITARGVVVPVVVDQHGRILDGHHRQAIATRLGLACPTEVRQVVDDEDARQTALALNLARRHLTREQRRDLIARECEAYPADSDRAIARRFGCSPSTVAAVRRPGVQVGQSEPMTKAEAEASVVAIRSVVLQTSDHVSDALGAGMPPAHVLASILDVLRRLPGPGEVQEATRTAVQPLVDDLTALVLDDTFQGRADVADAAYDRFSEACRS